MFAKSRVIYHDDGLENSIDEEQKVGINIVDILNVFDDQESCYDDRIGGNFLHLFFLREDALVLLKLHADSDENIHKLIQLVKNLFLFHNSVVLIL